MLMPSAISASIAPRPASVPGELIITFGRLTARQRWRASSIVLRVSSATPGETSRLTKPSRPSSDSKTWRNSAVASWMSSTVIAS